METLRNDLLAREAEEKQVRVHALFGPCLSSHKQFKRMLVRPLFTPLFHTWLFIRLFTPLFTPISHSLPACSHPFHPALLHSQVAAEREGRERAVRQRLEVALIKNPYRHPLDAKRGVQN
jgi:hypothetical protein